jgi:hypothetical protein
MSCKMKWPNLGLILLSGYILFLHGCASAPITTPVSAGQVFEKPEKGFSIAAPEGNYLYAEIKNGVLFSPQGGSDWQGSDDPRGDYTVQVFPKTVIPADSWGDLEKSMKWVNANFMSARAKKKMVTIKEEKRKFQGRDALYVETFLPEVVKEGVANLTVIVSSAFEYANLVFFQGDNFYYLTYADAVNGKYYFKTKLTPSVDVRVGQRLERFSEGFNVQE